MSTELDSGKRPTLRLLHHTARSGGTVIARCLGTMHGVCLLSEIHPAGTERHNPLDQAAEWHGLLTAADEQRLVGVPVSFEDAIDLIARRAAERGLTLVLRDWNHLDFHGVPFTRPTGRFLLAESLEAAYGLRRAYTVRHPLDQWLSMHRQPVLQDLSLEAFLAGALAYARAAAAAGFHRYEDFVAAPERVLRGLCDDLGLAYDAGWQHRWQAYDQVTGAGTGRAGDEIRTLPRRAPPPGLAERLEREPAYAEITSLLGYEA